MKKPDYKTIEKLISFIELDYRDACLRILQENRLLFENSYGSTNNHQVWKGGYIDHITDGMNYAYHLYYFDYSFGRHLPFTLSDVLLVFFLHDLEKPWRILVDKDGNTSNNPRIDSKIKHKEFREAKLREYGIYLRPDLLNGLTYVEGEISDYSSKKRVMNELASFCHKVDNWCARGWYDYPKNENDGWEGASRVRLTNS